jgi:uncharacterized protein (UPF0210 family)
MMADLAGWPDASVVQYAKELQAALEGAGVEWCSVGPALPSDGPARAELMGEVLAGNDRLNGSVLVATTESGMDQAAARAAAKVISYLAEATPEGFGNFNFAALACVGPGSPFLPAAYHEPGAPPDLTIALQGSGVVAEALAGGAQLGEVAGRVAGALERHGRPAVELASRQAEALGLAFGGIDLSPAPDGDDSIVAAMELAGLGPFGGPGTLALAASLTAGIRGTDLPACGYSGLMLPVMEDTVLAERWEEGRLGLEQLLALSAICGTGLDTVPLPGDSGANLIAAVISDMAALAVRLGKPLSARLLPVPGKRAGEPTEFSSPYLVNTLIKPLG